MCNSDNSFEETFAITILETRARSPHVVANIALQNPSIHHRVRGYDTKGESFRNQKIVTFSGNS